MTRSSQASAARAQAFPASPYAPAAPTPALAPAVRPAPPDLGGVTSAPAFVPDAPTRRRRGRAVAVFEPGLPPLTQRQVGAVALFAFEAIEGARLVAQLGGWISEEVADELTLLRTLNVERRMLHRDTRRVVASVQHARLSRITAGVVEATVVLATPSRCRGVALRFEAFRRRWQAVVLTVL